MTSFVREDVVRLLLKAEVDANAASSRGITPLHVAAKEGHFRLLQLLIFANSRVNAQSANGITPLVRSSCLMYALSCFSLTRCGSQHLAVLRRDDEMSVLLLQVKTMHFLRCPSFCHVLTSLTPSPFVSILLQSGADAFITDRDGQNAVSLATKRQRALLFGNMER